MKYSFFKENSRIWMPKETTGNSVLYNVVDVTGTVELKGGYPVAVFHHNDPEVKRHMGNPVKEHFGVSLIFYLPQDDLVEHYFTAGFAEFQQGVSNIFRFMEYPELPTVQQDIADKIVGSDFYVSSSPIEGDCMPYPRQWFLFVDKNYVDGHLDNEVRITQPSLTKIMQEIKKDE